MQKDAISVCKSVVHDPFATWKESSENTTIAQVVIMLGQIQLLAQKTQERALCVRGVKGWGHCGGQHSAMVGGHSKKTSPVMPPQYPEGGKNRAVQTWS